MRSSGSGGVTSSAGGGGAVESNPQPGNGISGNGISGNGISGNGISGNGISGTGISGNAAMLPEPVDDGAPMEGPTNNPDAGASDDTTALPPSPPCSLPSTGEANAVLFSGSMLDGMCRDALDAPYATFWYTYQDSGGVDLAITTPGCEPNTCSLVARGPTLGAPGYSTFGAGVGFQLSLDNSSTDLSQFSGIQFWARGTSTGTRGPFYTQGPGTVFVKFITDPVRLGDDFGAYCRLDPNAWTQCRSDFAALRRDGFITDVDPASDVLDLTSVIRVEFEFRIYRDSLGVAPVPVSFDVQLASISLY